MQAHKIRGFGVGAVRFKKIMIATDGSVCARMAANNAIELARLSGGTVYAVYVISTDYFSSMAIDLDWQRMHEALKKEGSKAVDYVAGIGEMEGTKVEPILLEGRPAVEIIRYAEEKGIDILIMGSLGKTGLDRLFLGSVTEKVIRNSKVPVMVIKEKCIS